MAVDPRTLLTYEDFLIFPDDGVRREIVDGEMYVTPSPDVRHQELVLRLGVAFSIHIDAHGGGKVFVAPLDDLLTEHDIVEPDIIFVADDRLGIIKEMNLQGSPTLVVEVVSDPRHDRVRKRALYARAGIPTYLIVDPDADRVEVYRLVGNAYGKPEIFEPGETIAFEELPGLVMTCHACFSVRDRRDPTHAPPRLT